MLQPVVYDDLFYRHPNSESATTTNDGQTSSTRESTRDGLPKMTSTAKHRFCEPHTQHCQLFPTNLIDWNDPTARSVSSSHEWLKSVECIVNTMVAFILTSTRFKDAETRASKIGIFTPWLKVTKHLVSYYSLSQWLDHKNADENPWSYLEQALGQNWKALPIETIASHIKRHPYQVRSILHIQTSITSASTTVTHALIIIPRHTKFTNNGHKD